MDSLAFYGTLVHSTSVTDPVLILENALIVIKGRHITTLQSGVVDKQTALKTLEGAGVPTSRLRVLEDGEFLMPGLVDTHIHAPQYATVGVGYDLSLLDWLNTYTYPVETRFSDLDFASRVYQSVVRRTLRNGTTTACYFATIHAEASLVLAEQMHRYGQRGYVGKVCMDQNSPPGYGETTEGSLRCTREFIETMRKKYEDRGLIEPCITPRFAITCSGKLLSGLASLADEFNLPIQTHMSENVREVSEVLALCDVTRYARVYEEAGLLTNKTILAHCVHSDDTELAILKNYNCGIAHCPNSNNTLYSGTMDTRKVQKYGVKLGLGTDVSGGYSTSILDNLRKSVEVSKLLSLVRNQNAETNDEASRYESISHHEAFYLATLGGAQVMDLDKRIGNFEVGKEFDALVVNTVSENSPYDTFGSITKADMLGKFLYCGDDRNIVEVYVAGKRVELDNLVAK